MKLLPFKHPFPNGRIKHIDNTSDAELEELGWRRLAQIPGVTVCAKTIQGRLRAGRSKRDACTMPPNRRVVYKTYLRRKA